MRSRSPGYLLPVPGWRLGLLTGGKTARTNRIEAWISYRGQDCENKQDRGLDIIQGGTLGERTGKKLGYHTGCGAARNIRDKAEITNRVTTGSVDRVWTWEKYQT
jgi:hypothetical protein